MSRFRSIECTHAVAQGQKHTSSSTWCHLITTPTLKEHFFCNHQSGPETRNLHKNADVCFHIRLPEKMGVKLQRLEELSERTTENCLACQSEEEWKKIFKALNQEQNHKNVDALDRIQPDLLAGRTIPPKPS